MEEILGRERVKDEKYKMPPDSLVCNVCLKLERVLPHCTRLKTTKQIEKDYISDYSLLLLLPLGLCVFEHEK